jgi:hypothetical protein
MIENGIDGHLNELSFNERYRASFAKRLFEF